MATLIKTIEPDGGDSSATCRPEVYIYKHVNPDKKYRKWAAEGVETVMDRLLNDNRIGDYKIYVYNSGTFFCCNADGNCNSYRKQLENWRLNNGFQTVGSHFAITRCVDNAYFQVLGKADGTGGWDNNDGADAWGRTRDDTGAQIGETYWKKIAAHEVLHNFLETSTSNGAYRMAGCTSDDHRLSTVTPYYDNETVMSAPGDDSSWKQGCCSSSTSPSGYTQRISSCTSKAMEYSAEWEIQDYCEGSVSDTCSPC